MDTTFSGQVGASDLMQATRAETRRIMAEGKNDPRREYELLLDKLASLELVTSDEAKQLVAMYERGYEAGEGKCEAHEAYFECRAQRDAMLADGRTSQVALTLASATVGGFEITQGPDGAPVILAAKRTFTGIGAAAGALLGAAIGGGLGASVGGAIGGAIGGIIDDKRGKK